RPIPPIGGSPDRRRQIAEQEINLRSKFTANIDHKHYSGLDDPEECLFMLGLTFVNTAFWLFADVYGYIDWYMKQNLFEKKYQDYFRLLQVLQSANPDRRLVMKAPEHSPKVDVLLGMIPSAQIIQTHRDPVAVVPSLNSLYYSIHISLTNQVDIKMMAETNLRLLAWEIEENLAARKKHAGQIFDIQYEQIIADPVGTVIEVYRHFQLPWPNGYEHTLQEYIEQNPKDKHGRHHYHP
ncbi:MAG: sulfotransferase, partial [Chloroflexi bacterium]|nr:sulfotransferase [Chloroflexota bacterium]